MHRTGPRHPLVGRFGGARLGTLHRYARMELEGVGHKAKRLLQELPQILGKSSLLGIGFEKWHNHPELFDFLDRVPHWPDGGFMPHSAARALKLPRVNSSHSPIMIEIVKRLMNTSKILQVGEDQELVGAKAFGLVHGNRDFLLGSSRRYPGHAEGEEAQS